MGTEDIVVKNAIEQLMELGLDAINVLKLDTEGSEVEIIKTLSPMFDRIRCILLEYHTAEDKEALIQILNEYKIYSLKEANANTGIICFSK